MINDKDILPQKRDKLKSVDELHGLENQQEASRHLQVMIDKPCVSAYFAGDVWPQIGERGNRFYALISELKRMGLNEESALDRITNYFNRVPRDILNSPGKDGKSFTLKELEIILHSSYKNDTVKSFGCNSGTWNLTCIGSDMCFFKKQLGNGKPQSREAGIYAFISYWLGAKDDKRAKLLKDSDVRIYFSLIDIEKKRGYEPGALLFVSWREISKTSGISRQNVGLSLENLFWQGLIKYQKGEAVIGSKTGSKIQRVIPVPVFRHVLNYDITS